MRQRVTLLPPMGLARTEGGQVYPKVADCPADQQSRCMAALIRLSRAVPAAVAAMKMHLSLPRGKTSFALDYISDVVVAADRLQALCTINRSHDQYTLGLRCDCPCLNA